MLTNSLHSSWRYVMALSRLADGEKVSKSTASLLGAIGAIPGVAETWQDVGVFVESFVDRCQPDGNVWVNASHTLDTFRCPDEAYKQNVVRAALFQPVH